MSLGRILIPTIKTKDIESFELKNVCLHAGITEQKNLLKNTTMSLPKNEVVFVKGSHGVGKSIFLKMLAGLFRPSSGEYLINNESVYDMDFEELNRYRVNIGYVMESGGLISNMTIRENLSLPLAYHEVGSSEAQKVKVDNVIEQYGLASIAQSYPAELAGSFRRLASVARAMIMEPQLLILDNPETGLQEKNKQIINKQIKKSFDNKTLKHVFFVSNDTNFIELLGPTSVLEIKALDIRSQENTNESYL